MLIACPFCKTEAQISEDLEGSKVKCPKCAKTYQARAKRERGDAVLTPMRVVLAALVVPIVGGFAIYVANRTADDTPPAAQAAATERPTTAPAAPALAPAASAPAAPAVPWNTEALDGVRALLAAIGSADVQRTASTLAGAEARERARALVQASDEFAFGNWKPGELRITAQDAATSTVAATLISRENASVTSAWEFRLTKDGGRWKVVDWSRTATDTPASAASKKAGSGDARDAAAGAMQVDVAPRHLEHLASTPPEQRAEIEGLYAKMIDLSLSPTENVRASDRLAELGKPALPVLLNGILDTRCVDVDSMSKVVLINQTLQRITDHTTVFAPGPNATKVEELRLETVKSWFSWWGYSGERFQTKPKAADPFDNDPDLKKKH